MKRFKILSAIIMVILLSGCEEVKDPAGQRDTGAVPLISDVSGLFITGQPDSYVQFTVSLGSGISVDKGEIEVSRQDNFERVKLTDISSFPSGFTISLGEVAEKLGQIDAGDLIYIEVVTTSRGITTRSNAALGLIVFCGYNKDLASGSYHSVSPPADWNSEGDILITSDPEDPYTVFVSGLEAMEGLTEDQGPLVMHIDPVTFAVTADRTVLASDAWGETNIAYEGSGTFNSCSGSYRMNFDISTDQSDYGVFAFTFTRK